MSPSAAPTVQSVSASQPQVLYPEEDSSSEEALEADKKSEVARPVEPALQSGEVGVQQAVSHEALRGAVQSVLPPIVAASVKTSVAPAVRDLCKVADQLRALLDKLERVEVEAAKNARVGQEKLSDVKTFVARVEAKVEDVRTAVQGWQQPVGARPCLVSREGGDPVESGRSRSETVRFASALEPVEPSEPDGRVEEDAARQRRREKRKEEANREGRKKSESNRPHSSSGKDKRRDRRDDDGRDGQSSRSKGVFSFR